MGVDWCRFLAHNLLHCQFEAFVPDSTHSFFSHQTHQTCWHPGVSAAEPGLISEVLTQRETTRTVQTLCGGNTNRWTLELSWTNDSIIAVPAQNLPVTASSCMHTIIIPFWNTRVALNRSGLLMPRLFLQQFHWKLYVMFSSRMDFSKYQKRRSRKEIQQLNWNR